MNYYCHFSFKTVWIILVSVILMLMLNSCKNKEDNKHIALIFTEKVSENPFWLRLKKGAETAARESDMELKVYEGSKRKVDSEIEELKKAIQNQPEGLLIIPPPTNSNRLVPELKDADPLPVIVLDRPLELSESETLPQNVQLQNRPLELKTFPQNVLLQIGFDGLEGGKEIGKWVYKRLCCLKKCEKKYKKNQECKKKCQEKCKKEDQESGQNNCQEYEEKARVLILSGKVASSLKKKRYDGFECGLQSRCPKNDNSTKVPECETIQDWCPHFDNPKNDNSNSKCSENNNSTNGLIEILECEKKIEWTRKKGFKTTQKWLRRYHDIDAILATNDELALGALDAVWRAGYDDIFVTGIDGNANFLRDIREGYSHATIDQRPFTQGYIAVKLMIAHLDDPDDSTKIKKYVDALDGVKYVKENVEELIEKAMSEKNKGHQQLWETPLIDKQNVDKEYETNVVLTGIKIHEISDFNKKDFTFFLDFSLWFWWHQKEDENIEPQDIVFLNAVKPIKLLASGSNDLAKYFYLFNKNIKEDENLVVEPVVDKKNNVVYRVKGRFDANFLPSQNQNQYQRVLGEHMIGLRFRHVEKNRNELLYTPDILGMDLYKEELQQQVASSEVFHLTEPKSFYLKPVIWDARIFNEVTSIDIAGKPNYSQESTENEGTGEIYADTEFSHFTVAIYIKPFSQDFLHTFYKYVSYFFNYVSENCYFSPLMCLILFCVGLVVIYYFIDRKKKKLLRFRSWAWVTEIKLLWCDLTYRVKKRWSKHCDASEKVLLHNLYIYLIKFPFNLLFTILKTLFLLVLTLFVIFVIFATYVILLLGFENLVIQYCSLEYHYLYLITIFFDILMWLIPAAFLIRVIDWRLLKRKTEPEVSTPEAQEAKTEPEIPTLVGTTIKIFIYMLAIIGIITFVFEQKEISLLAISGLLVIAIGFTMKNLSNLFSGFALTIGQPFKIGDRVKIGNFGEGEVINIAWRSTAIRISPNTTLYIPNNAVANSSIHNFGPSQNTET